MSARVNFFGAASSLMWEWQRAAHAISSSLDPRLSALVKIRVSQINGCANCLDMHTVHARESGETEQRIYLLPAWRDAPCYTDRERAALGWAEALTQLSEAHAREVAYEALWSEFSREDQIRLTLLINIINGYNRLAAGLGDWPDPATVRSATEAAVAA